MRHPTTAQLTTLSHEIPVAPDADEASEWVTGELEKTKYQEAPAEEGPNWLLDMIDRVNEFIASLGGEGTAPAWSAILIVVAIVIVVLLFLIFGLPRLRRRSSLVRGDVFEADDERGSGAMRRESAAAAAEGDWQRAIAERFRAIVRGLHERTLVASLPGSTAHDVARRASATLPAFAERLSRAAHDFDAVRYLGDPGDQERYARLAALDDEIGNARPDFSNGRDGAALVGFEAPR